MAGGMKYRPISAGWDAPCTQRLGDECKSRSSRFIAITLSFISVSLPRHPVHFRVRGRKRSVLRRGRENCHYAPDINLLSLPQQHMCGTVVGSSFSLPPFPYRILSLCFGRYNSSETRKPQRRVVARDGFEPDSNSPTRRLARVFASSHWLATRPQARNTLKWG